MVIDERIVRELQARNEQLGAEIYRQARRPLQPAKFVIAGVLLGAGIMAVSLVLLAWI